MIVCGCTPTGRITLAAPHDCYSSVGNAVVAVDLPKRVGTTRVHLTVRYGSQVAIEPQEYSVEEPDATHFVVTVLGSVNLCLPDSWAGDVPQDSSDIISGPTKYRVTITDANNNDAVLAEGDIEIVPRLPQ